MPGNVAVPVWIWYTVTNQNGFPIQRKFYFPLPYGFQRQSIVNGQLLCGYSYPPARSVEGDWELSGGTLWIKFAQILGMGGFAKGIRVEGGYARRVTPIGGGGDGGGCDTQIIYDPAAPCPGGGGGGGTGGGDDGTTVTTNPSSGPSGSNCTVEFIVIEVSNDGGATWSTWWQGYANVCS